MDNWLIFNILSFFVTLICDAAIVPHIMKIAHTKHLFDSVGDRKVHTGAVPRLGGVAFTPSIIFTVLLMLAIGLGDTPTLQLSSLDKDLSGMFLLFCSMLALFMVGLADDLIEIRYRNKFIIQILVGVLVVKAGVIVDNLYGFIGIYHLPDVLAWALTILVIVYIINSFNLIDGIDGLSGSLALLPILFYGYICYSTDHYLYSMIAFGAAGSIIPFLYFNVFGSIEKKKKIFMGDTGSLTIGLIIGFLGIEVIDIGESGKWASNANPIILAFSPLVIPMFDQLRVFFHRIIRKRNPFLPDKCHIHHKLLYLGYSTRRALVVILAAAIAFIVFNMALSSMDIQVTWILLIDLIVWTIVNILVTSAIRRREQRLNTDLYK